MPILSIAIRLSLTCLSLNISTMCAAVQLVPSTRHCAYSNCWCSLLLCKNQYCSPTITASYVCCDFLRCVLKPSVWDALLPLFSNITLFLTPFVSGIFCTSWESWLHKVIWLVTAHGLGHPLLCFLSQPWHLFQSICVTCSPLAQSSSSSSWRLSVPSPALFTVFVFHVYYINPIQKGILLNHMLVVLSLFVLFLLHCLYFKDKDSYLWIASSHGEVSLVFKMNLLNCSEWEHPTNWTLYKFCKFILWGIIFILRN